MCWCGCYAEAVWFSDADESSGKCKVIFIQTHSEWKLVSTVGTIGCLHTHTCSHRHLFTMVMSCSRVNICSSATLLRRGGAMLIFHQHPHFSLWSHEAACIHVLLDARTHARTHTHKSMQQLWHAVYHIALVTCTALSPSALSYKWLLCCHNNEQLRLFPCGLCCFSIFFNFIFIFICHVMFSFFTLAFVTVSTAVSTHPVCFCSQIKWVNMSRFWA